MKEYSVWVDETEKIVSFHEVDNSELMRQQEECKNIELQYSP